MKTRERSTVAVWAPRAVLLMGVLVGAGCGGGSGGGGVPSISGLSLGSLVPGQTGQYLEAGGKGLSAATMDVKDEDDLGQSVAIAATNRWPLYENPALTKYVTMVGLTLADVTPNPTGNWVFGVLDTPEVGAYSGPNGYIMVTRGALALMQDESELAGVLAHEMGHVLNRDGFKAVQKAKLAEAGMQGLSAKEQKVALFNQMTDGLVDKVFQSGWDPGQETGADSKAVQLLQAAGYDAGGLARFLKRMEAAKGGSGSGKMFSTHPGTNDRVGRITSQAGAKGGATYGQRFAKAKAEGGM